MTNNTIEQRKQRFASGKEDNQPPIGLISRGSEALSEPQITQLWEQLMSQPAISRSWPQIRVLRESSLKSSQRPQVLRMTIETCIAQSRVELESSTRSLLEYPLNTDEKLKYKKIRALALLNSGNTNDAFELVVLVDFAAAFVQQDLYSCGSLASEEPDPMVRQLMQLSIEIVAKAAIAAVKKGLRPLSRPDAIEAIQDFSRSWISLKA